MASGFGSKRDLLRDVRRRPEFWLAGPLERAHLSPALTAPCYRIFEFRHFGKPRGGTLRVAPHQYHLRFHADPPQLDEDARIDWENSDDLLLTLLQVRTRERCRGVFSPWGPGSFAIPRYDYDLPAATLYLADRGALAIGSRQGLWCQAYENGWPVTPPCLAENGCGIALMVAAALSPRWFTGLPYTREAVEETVPSWIRRQVAIEWHDEDDLVPACPQNPGCVLDPRNTHLWLET